MLLLSSFLGESKSRLERKRPKLISSLTMLIQLQSDHYEFGLERNYKLGSF